MRKYTFYKKLLAFIFLLTTTLFLNEKLVGQNITNYTFNSTTTGSLIADNNSQGSNAIDMSTGFVQLIGENSSTSGVASALLNLNLNIDPTLPTILYLSFGLWEPVIPSSM